MKSPAQAAPSVTTRQKLLLVAALALTLASAGWIYYFQFTAPDLNRPLHQSVGIVLAEETVRAVGPKGKVVIITMPASQAAELQVQMQAFLAQLKVVGGGVRVLDKVVLEPGDNPKYRPGAGLSAKHFLKIARKHPGADALVSFIGAPDLSSNDLQQLKSLPRFIAETRSPDKLTTLLQQKVLLAAVVPRFDFPAPGPRQPRTTRQWFDHYFQVVRVDTPLPDSEPAP